VLRLHNEWAVLGASILADWSKRAIKTPGRMTGLRIPDYFLNILILKL
jgi:hypothetical protein